MTRLRVGVLGGSFNPAHEGHRYISLLALQRLGLDQVWWLVSPQNPLKDAKDMMSFSDRLKSAQAMAKHPQIRVSDLENRMGTRFTAETLPRLKQRFPHIGFVWLMGADNLAQIPAWHRWEEIFRAVPVAIFDRGTYSYFHKALSGKAARRFSQFRVPANRAKHLADLEPPAWTYIREIRRHPGSATAIRRGLKPGESQAG
jgi:nicotinate-nucleotide adenylyltransferase